MPASAATPAHAPIPAVVVQPTAAAEHATLADLIAGWPADRPLVAAVPHPPPADPASPGTEHDAIPAIELAASPSGVWRAVADGHGGWRAETSGDLGIDPAELEHARDPFAALDALVQRRVASPEAGPFPGGWLATLAYPLGTIVEPTAGRSPAAGTPLLELARIDHAYLRDVRTGEAWTIGSPPAALRQDGGNRAPIDPRGGSLRLGLDTPGSRYEAGVARIVEYLRAGDAFQVNLAHRLSCDAAGIDPRALFAGRRARVRPRHGFYAEPMRGQWSSTQGPAAVLCLSPERFLAMAPGSRRVWTRPMKGTRPAGDRHRAELEASAKDRAELAMIVDLMRNDLGRVAVPGSVRVDERRVIETHGNSAAGAVLQGVATVSAELRDDRTLGDLLRATFPPGSVTGAPKVRAMQIIDELEASPRGVYTGAMGLISDTGLVDLAVTIRTAVLAGGRLTYHAGAGIVADSIPEAELAETIDKARALGPVEWEGTP